MSLTVTVLGCGASAGVPLIGCDCAVCTSDNPKDKRSRVSILIEKGNTRVLIDTSPDIRQQALDNQFKTVDAIIYTHAHADHCHGIDEVRSFNYHRDDVIPCYADAPTMSELKQRFAYMFLPPQRDKGWFRGALEPNVIELNLSKPVIISEDITFIPFAQQHGQIQTMGVRIDDFVYSTDVNNFMEESKQALENMDVWLVDSLRYEPAPTHAHFDLTLDWIREFKPKRAILTHLSHSFDYETLQRTTPEHVEPAYDGMRIIL